MSKNSIPCPSSCSVRAPQASVHRLFDILCATHSYMLLDLYCLTFQSMCSSRRFIQNSLLGDQLRPPHHSLRAHTLRQLQRLFGCSVPLRDLSSSQEMGQKARRLDPHRGLQHLYDMLITSRHASSSSSSPRIATFRSSTRPNMHLSVHRRPCSA